MITLYSMMGDKFIESFDEKSIMAHRLMALKGIDYKTNVASLDSMAKDIGKAVGMFPVIRTSDGEILHDREQLYEFFSRFSPHLSNESFSRPFFIKHVSEWALDSLTKRVRYFLLLEVENWKKLKSYLENIYSGSHHLETMQNIRKVTQIVYKNSLFSRLDYRSKLDAIEEDLSMIDHWASENRFIAGDDISLADIALFSVIHLMFHPYIEEIAIFKERFTNLNRWAMQIDKLTTNEYTKKLQLKL